MTPISRSFPEPACVHAYIAWSEGGAIHQPELERSGGGNAHRQPELEGGEASNAHPSA